MKTKMWKVIFEEPNLFGTSIKVECILTANNIKEAQRKAMSSCKGEKYRQMKDIVAIEKIVETSS